MIKPTNIIEEHKYLVGELTKSGNAILVDMDTRDAHLVHMVLGISGEAGELLDAIKKKAIYQKELDIENIYEELGDIEFYLEGLRSSLNISRELVLSKNIEKLTKRYGADLFYTNKAAQERKDKE